MAVSGWPPGSGPGYLGQSPSASVRLPPSWLLVALRIAGRGRATRQSAGPPHRAWDMVFPARRAVGCRYGGSSPGDARTPDFDVAHCPERINPGDPKWNVYNIPRNIGSTNTKVTKRLADFYRSFVNAEINEMPNLKTAEATKIIENTFRDINIAFVNELAKSFDVLGIDLMAVIKGASNKPFAFMPHFPSCGVGGHCIPVDPYYLIERAKQSGFDHKFLKLAREINNSMPDYAINLLTKALNEHEKPIKNTPIGLLGLSYKANVGDIRESPSVKLKNILLERGAELLIYDPFFPDMCNTNSLDEILDKSYAILIATDHSEFKEITPEILNSHNVKVVIDGKNCLNKKIIKEAGIYYKGMGT